LFAIWPFLGHVNPFVPVAEALRVNGHEVAFYTGASASAVLSGEGFTVFPFQALDERRAWNAVIQAESAAARGQRSLAVLRAVRDWIAGSVSAQVSDLEPLVVQWAPDIIVAETAMWGPILVIWERLGKPVVVASTLLGCLIPRRDAPPPGSGLPMSGPLAPVCSAVVRLATDFLARGMRRQLDAVRADYGLPALGCPVNAFLGRLPLYLIPSVPELDYNRRDLPTSVQYIGPCVWSKPSGSPAPRWSATLSGSHPLVHVTEGTVHYRDPFLLRAAARGLAGEPVQVLLTTGPQRNPEALDLGELAANVQIEQWIPHSELLPRCAAMVTTGGAGTVMAGLQAGVPMVIVPTLWDKADNARRIVQAGAGVEIAPGACTPGRVRAAVERVLRDPRYRLNARRLADRLASAPGPVRAAELLAGLAGTEARAA
jgi:MGT family glycosyltransferase